LGGKSVVWTFSLTAFILLVTNRALIRPSISSMNFFILVV